MIIKVDTWYSSTCVKRSDIILYFLLTFKVGKFSPYLFLTMNAHIRLNAYLHVYNWLAIVKHSQTSVNQFFVCDVISAEPA